LYELQPDLDPDSLLQEALDLLMHGDAPAAVHKARAVQTQATATDQPVYSGWALWMIGLAHIYMNEGDQAQRYLTEANNVALATQQSPLAMAVYLAQQLISEYQHQTQLRQYVTRLLRELDERESRLTQQFRTMLKLATDTWIGTQPLNLTLPAPEAVPAPMQSAASGGAEARAHYLPSLEVRCLGAFQVIQAGQDLELRPGKKSLDIFKYLLAHRERPVSKDTLIHLLWPEVPAGRGAHRLHLAISGLRSMLNPREQETASYILFREDAYLINPLAPVSVDVDLFVANYQRGLELEKSGRKAEGMTAHEAAVALYRDDYLIENLYDDWTVTTREHLRQMYMTMLSRLGAAYLRQQRDEDATAAARRMLARDNCSEEGHRLLMLVYSRAGQRTQALRQYQLCADTLRKELGADPSPALSDLYREIAGQVE
jgi:DNA-binding SARP family transcriptional activator